MIGDWPPININRKNYIWWHKYSTRWGDNDIYGHVNNNIYYSMFDTVVNYFLIIEADFDPIKSNYIGVTPETRCRYYKSIKYPATVDVGIVTKKIGNSSIRYEVGVFKEHENEPCAVGYFVHVYVDRTHQEKVIPIPRNIYKACKSILKSN
jgi:acyl-CoA thioester hydrolase